MAYRLTATNLARQDSLVDDTSANFTTNLVHQEAARRCETVKAAVQKHNADAATSHTDVKHISKLYKPTIPSSATPLQRSITVSPVMDPSPFYARKAMEDAAIEEGSHDTVRVRTAAAQGMASCNVLAQGTYNSTECVRLAGDRASSSSSASDDRTVRDAYGDIHGLGFRSNDTAPTERIFTGIFNLSNPSTLSDVHVPCDMHTPSGRYPAVLVLPEEHTRSETAAFPNGSTATIACDTDGDSDDLADGGELASNARQERSQMRSSNAGTWRAGRCSLRRQAPRSK